jgi:hypothetical protein
VNTGTASKVEIEIKTKIGKDGVTGSDRDRTSKRK